MGNWVRRAAAVETAREIVGYTEALRVVLQPYDGAEALNGIGEEGFVPDPTADVEKRADAIESVGVTSRSKVSAQAKAGLGEH
jgi:hypothetical protein